MGYQHVPVANVRGYCEALFKRCGFSRAESETITDVLLVADLFGIESHGVQRLIRYDQAIKEGSIVPGAPWRTVSETALSKVLDAPRTMGQVMAKEGMQTAIDKAKANGIGLVTVRGTNHFGIAGYYARMAMQEDLLGLCMTNTEALAVPTFGSRAMLGTNPLAVGMPAEPIGFLFDASTTVVTRGKLEVYGKQERPLPLGWAADETGAPASDAIHVLEQIVSKKGGGLFPLGGALEETASHKGYGLGLIVELFTAVLGGGTPSPAVARSGNADTSFFFAAIDYGLFGDKETIKGRMSALLEDLRQSPKAKGQERIYTHGEKEWLSWQEKMKTGIPIHDKTRSELIQIGRDRGLNAESFGL